MELSVYLKEQVALSDQFLTEIDTAFSYEELPKGYRLVEPYSMSKKLFFVEKGLVRSFYFKDGRDITHHFTSENDFLASIDSIFFGQESPYGCELLEPSVVRTVNYDVMQQFISNSLELNSLVQLFLLKVTKSFSDRLFSIQFQTAHERYNSMLKVYPNIFSRAPLGHIASYIGITQQTLSVIRAKK